MELDFLQNFRDPRGILSLRVGKFSTGDRLYVKADEPLPEIEPSNSAYFGPAFRKSPGDEKEDVLGTRVLWVDVDHEVYPQPTLPASVVVWSGHGWHLYWFLDEPLMNVDEIESANKVLISDIPTADKSCWNVNRIMRLPGSTNLKNEPIKCEIRKEPKYIYKAEDIAVVAQLGSSTRHKIKTGDRRGYKSRSERDWAIIAALMRAGARDELVQHLFENQPCGDKHRDPESPNGYLSHTISKARSEVPKAERRGDSYLEQSDGYYYISKRGSTRVSTFTIHPRYLLDGSTFGAEDAIVGNVRASGYEWPDVTFTRSAFTSVAKMDRECPTAAWQWLGRDDSVRGLLPYLLNSLQEMGMPRIMSVPDMGLHFYKDKPYFVGDTQTITSETIKDSLESKIAWLPSKREHPEVHFGSSVTDEELSLMREYLPKINEPEVFWIMLGWYAAAPLKPWFEKKGFRFPILNVTGTRGSGKTTMIQRVFMPLFGQKEPKSYDAGTTKFVTLSLLGSTNAIPISFSEFRYDSVPNFLRYILLSYDTGHDPRGRADQTTVDYALSAPFSMDGEDLIADPAARERIVVAALHPNAVEEGSECYDTFRDHIQNRIPSSFGGFYIKTLLRWMDEGVCDDLLRRASAAIFEGYPGKLPDRVRNNHIVAYMGVLLYARVIGMEEPPSPMVFRRSIQSVFNLNAGRARTLVDDFLEAVVNAVPTTSFRYAVDNETKGDSTILKFQVSTAHNWWIAARRRQGRSSLERDAIVTQLKEAEYFINQEVVDNVWMAVIDLQKAFDFGLDVPKKLNDRRITVGF